MSFPPGTCLGPYDAMAPGRRLTERPGDGKAAPPDAALPQVHELTRAQFLLSELSIAAAGLLIASLAFNIATQLALWWWWVPLVVVAGIAAVDFTSGLIHWGADTWGRDDLPVLGPRLLTPFRVHHINPDDFLTRRFVDANGDVALLNLPVLIGLHTVPLDTTWGGPVAIFGLAFSGVGVMTNQIHQWAHTPSPPPPVALLQEWGLLLGRAAHSAHHDRPYDMHYCITTGWCNRPLEAIRFFRRFEAAITRLTGVHPRRDDRRYETQYGVPTSEGPLG